MHGDVAIVTGRVDIVLEYKQQKSAFSLGKQIFGNSFHTSQSADSRVNSDRSTTANIRFFASMATEVSSTIL